jgi:hypothetical protein
MWNVKKSDTGTGSNGYKWYLSKVPGKHDKELQKTAVLGTAHTHTHFGKY